MATEATKPITCWEAERRAIVEALRWARGDKMRAAVVLEIGLSTIRRKILGFEIKPEEWQHVETRMFG